MEVSREELVTYKQIESLKILEVKEEQESYRMKMKVKYKEEPQADLEIVRKSGQLFNTVAWIEKECKLLILIPITFPDSSLMDKLFFTFPSSSQLYSQEELRKPLLLKIVERTLHFLSDLCIKELYKQTHRSELFIFLSNDYLVLSSICKENPAPAQPSVFSKMIEAWGPARRLDSEAQKKLEKLKKDFEKLLEEIKIVLAAIGNHIRSLNQLMDQIRALRQVIKDKINIIKQSYLKIETYRQFINLMIDEIKSIQSRLTSFRPQNLPYIGAQVDAYEKFQTRQLENVREETKKVLAEFQRRAVKEGIKIEYKHIYPEFETFKSQQS